MRERTRIIKTTCRTRRDILRNENTERERWDNHLPIFIKKQCLRWFGDLSRMKYNQIAARLHYIKKKQWEDPGSDGQTLLKKH